MLVLTDPELKGLDQEALIHPLHELAFPLAGRGEDRDKSRRLSLSVFALFKLRSTYKRTVCGGPGFVHSFLDTKTDSTKGRELAQGWSLDFVSTYV